MHSLRLESSTGSWHETTKYTYSTHIHMYVPREDVLSNQRERRWFFFFFIYIQGYSLDVIYAISGLAGLLLDDQQSLAQAREKELRKKECTYVYIHIVPASQPGRLLENPVNCIYIYICMICMYDMYVYVCMHSTYINVRVNEMCESMCNECRV